MPSPRLSARQRLTWLAHFYKAVARRHHQEMREVFRPWLPPDGVAIDAGAHAGHVTKLLAGMAPRGQVHAIEPGSYALSILRKMRAIRRLSNVVIHPCGLGDRDETLTLNVPIKASGSVGYGLSFVGDRSGGGGGRRTMAETVRLRRLDDIVRDAALPRVDLIKLDVEGSELRALMGAEATLDRFGPALFVEVEDDYLTRRGDSSEALAAWLRGRGYGPADGWERFPAGGDWLFARLAGKSSG